MRLVEIRIVGSVGFENGVNSGKQHPANSNNRFLVPTTLFEQKIAVLDFRVLCGVANGESALHKQRFEESARTGDTSGFLLAGALIVLGNESRPRTEMFRRREHGHIHADFGDNGNGRSGLDTRNGRNEINLRSEVFGKRRNKSMPFIRLHKPSTAVPSNRSRSHSKKTQVWLRQGCMSMWQTRLVSIALYRVL